MPKFINDLGMDAELDFISANGQRMMAISAYTFGDTYATVVAASLADVALAPADFTKADGTTSGRKTTVGAKSAVPVDATGTATHVAIVDDTNTRVIAVTTCTSQALTSGNTVNFPAWTVTEIGDPA